MIALTIIFMCITMVLYIFYIKYFHHISCPRCNHQIMDKEERFCYTLFFCKSCRFSFKNYYNFYSLTSIDNRFEIDFFSEEEEEEDREEIEPKDYDDYDM